MGTPRLGLLLFVGCLGAFDAAKGQNVPGLNPNTLAAAPQAGWSFSNLGQTLTGVVRNAISAVGGTNPTTQQAGSVQIGGSKGEAAAPTPSSLATAAAPAAQAALLGISTAAAPVYQGVAGAIQNATGGALSQMPDGTLAEPLSLPGYLGIAAVHAAAPVSQGARDALAVTNAGILPGVQTANSALRSAVGGVNQTYTSAVSPANTLLQGAAALLPFAPAIAPAITPLTGGMARALGPAASAAQALASGVSAAPTLLSAQQAVKDAADAASTVSDNVNLGATSLVPPMPVRSLLPVAPQDPVPAEAPEVDHAIDAAVGATLLSPAEVPGPVSTHMSWFQDLGLDGMYRS
jgi:hypothetical protein